MVNPTVTTVSATTTVPVQTTVQATTTTLDVPPGEPLLAAVTSGILGCNFQPPSASTRRGSAVRFRNDTAGGVTLSITPPAGAQTTLSLESGATSPLYPLATVGSYAVTCTPGGDSPLGRMTITATST